jgi:hypothetical protein
VVLFDAFKPMRFCHRKLALVSAVKGALLFEMVKDGKADSGEFL